MDWNISYGGDEFLQRKRLGVHVGKELNGGIFHVRLWVVQRLQAFEFREIKTYKRHLASRAWAAHVGQFVGLEKLPAIEPFESGIASGGLVVGAILDAGRQNRVDELALRKFAAHFVHSFFGHDEKRDLFPPFGGNYAMVENMIFR